MRNEIVPVGAVSLEARVIEADPSVVAERVKARMADHLSPEQNRLLEESFRLACGMEPSESFDEVVRRFLEAKCVAGRTERTLGHYRDTLLAFSGWAGCSPQEVTTDMVRSYLAERRTAGVTDVTVNNIRRVLSSFFAWCDAEDVVHKSVMRRIEPVKMPKRIKRAFSDADLVRIREACRTARERALVELLLSTGARVTEASGLDRASVDLQRGFCDVFGKGRKERRCFLNEDAIYYLSDYWRERDDERSAAFVAYAMPHGRLRASAMERDVRRIGERAGVADCHPHRFRRTMATNALRRGMPVERVQRLLGHESIDTTLLYAIVDDEDVAYSARRLLS